MTQQQIQQLFQQRYNQNSWKQFLAQAFANARLLSTPEILTGINTDVATEVVRLGYIVLSEDGIERNIAVYDVTLAKGIVLERNRVGLRNLLRKYWKDIDAAFIVYHRPENPNWRFTYVSELTGFDAEGELIKVKTEPKRYTYILGEGESCRTAAERFAIIAKKGSSATLDDVKDAFSVEKLSKAFFEEYKEHYENFVEFLTGKRLVKSGSKWKEKQTGKPNPQLAYIFNGDEKEARDFNKKLLGRIVFLYFIQKKGWMGVPEKSNWGQGDPNFLWNLFDNCSNKGIFYSEYLSKLFFDTLNTQRKDDLIELIPDEKIRIPFLNGGLFEEDNVKYRNLIFPAELFENLFQFFNQYNFTIYEDDPNDHTVAVDPEMLGHIFENLLEDNKDKGAYYTPKEIVHYMCQESLIEYLCTTLKIEDEVKEKEAITALLKNKEIDEILKPGFQNINKALDKVKICDPAIGSGAFPMGLLKEIFTAKQTLYTFEHGNTEGFDASDVKLNIIQNSIYGVDIEKGAVDIARLRFWLSLVVDEDEPKALPNLDYKIVVGNCLVSKLGDLPDLQAGDVIDIDWSLDETSHGLFGQDLLKQKGKLLKKISNEQKEFFNPNSDKKKLAADIRNLKIDLLSNQLELMVKTQGLETQPGGQGKAIAKQTERYLETLGWKSQIEKLKKLKNKPEKPLHFFDWKLDFPEVMNEQVTNNVGFDIVIGNPPYVDVKGLPKNDAKLLFKIFTTTENRINLYSIFLEKGLKLGNDSSNLIFINPNSLLLNSSYKKIRKLLLPSVNKIIKLPDGVFENAIVETMIFQSFRKNTHQEVYGAYYKNDEDIDFKSLNFKFFLRKEWEKDIESRFNIFVSQEVISVIETIDKASRKQISDYFDFSLGITPYDSYKGHSKQLIKSKGYHSPTKVDDTYVPLISGKNVIRYLVYNEVEEYLKYGSWLGAPRQKKFFTKPRVIVRQIISGKPPMIYAGYTETELYHTQIGFSIISKNGKLSIKIICALLNSKLINFYHSAKFLDPQKNIFQKILIENCKQFPLAELLFKVGVPEKLIVLVDKILALKSQGQETTALEQQIDNLVYKLYELTYEEVKVIDPEFGLSEQEYEKIKV